MPAVSEDGVEKLRRAAQAAPKCGCRARGADILSAAGIFCGRQRMSAPRSPCHSLPTRRSTGPRRNRPPHRRSARFRRREVAQAFIARIEEVNPRLNAVVVPRFEEAAGRGRGGRRAAGPRRAARPAARRADHGQGVLSPRGHAVDDRPGQRRDRAAARRRWHARRAGCGGPGRSSSARRTCRSS